MPTGRLNPTDRPVMFTPTPPTKCRRSMCACRRTIRTCRTCHSRRWRRWRSRRDAATSTSTRRGRFAPSGSRCSTAIQQDRAASGRPAARAHRERGERAAERSANRHGDEQLRHVQLLQPELRLAEHVGAAAHALHGGAGEFLKRPAPSGWAGDGLNARRLHRCENALAVVGIVVRFAGCIPFGPVKIEHRPDDVGDDFLHTAVALLPRGVGQRNGGRVRVRDRNPTELLTRDYPWCIHAM